MTLYRRTSPGWYAVESAEISGWEGTDAMSSRWLTLARIAWVGLALFQVIFFLAGVYHREENALGLAVSPGAGAVLWAGLPVDFYPPLVVIMEGLFLGALLAFSGMILFRRVIGPVGILAAFVLSGFGPTILDTLQNLMATDPRWRIAGTLVALSGQVAIVPLLYHIPDRYRQPRWNHVASLLWVVTTVAGHFAPPSSPWQMGGGRLFLLVAGLQILVAVGVLFGRYRSVLNPSQRLQFRWVLFGLTAAAGGLAVMTWLVVPHLQKLYPNSVAVLMIQLISPYLFLLLVPASTAAAILPERIWDVRFLIQRSILYSTLTALVAGLYALVVVGFGSLLRSPHHPVLSPLAVGVVAVLIMPMQLRLRRAVNQLVYGQRDDPYALVSRLSRRLETAVEPDTMLHTIVEVVAEALKLPYAEITVREDGTCRTAATCGMPVETTLVLPLVYQAEQVGELRLAPRRQGEPWLESDRILLRELARPAGAAANAVRLNSELRQTNAHLATARERLVTAREEERRLLRQSLHDGLSPTLAAFSLKIGAIRRVLQRDPEGADRMLVELSKEIEVTVSDIRRLVDSLRPPAIDQVGLLGALRGMVASLWQGVQLPRMQLDLPEELPTLPAAVEVAAYLIAQEGLANVLSYPDAQWCVLRLRLEGRFLHLSITDDTSGRPADAQFRAAILAMRERAQELGGVLKLGSAPGGGTRVEAYLPVLPVERSNNVEH